MGQPDKTDERTIAQENSAWSERLVAVAGALAGGIGVIGIVTFAGGVVMWERFTKMGVPPDQAVAVVPTSVLISTGARFLVPALLTTGGIVLALIFLSQMKSWRSSNETRLVISAVVASALLVGEVAFAVVEFTNHVVPIVILVVFALGGAAVIGVALYALDRGPAFLALVGFPAVAAFFIASAFEHTSYYPRVLPMAYTRAEPRSTARVETGYLIAETSDRIWFASLPRSQKLPGSGTETANELREFPRSETDDLETGVLTDMSQAEKQAATFASNLCLRLWDERRLAAGGCPTNLFHRQTQAPRKPPPTKH